MAEFEFPGVFLEEVEGKPKPIDGVPTGTGAPLGKADRARWLYAIAIGGVALAGLAFWSATIRGSVTVELLRSPGGIAAFGAIFLSAFVLSILRTLVRWRRRRRGRPPLAVGRLAIGLVVFQLALLVALGICLAALVLSLLVARAFTQDLVVAGLDVLVGGTWATLAGAALRDLLLLVQAARADP